MGCDIHCYIEHATPGDNPYWMSFGGRINPGRDYQMFSLLADVRNYDPKTPVLVEPRGLPDGMGYAASSDAYLYVSDDLAVTDGCCSQKDAERWVSSGLSTWIGDDKKRVTGPDWHSHSWMTLDEWRSAVNAHAEGLASGGWKIDPAYLAVTEAMQAFENAGEIVRIVFWFDN
ncbi:MAG: hypothetical protein KKG69_17950 [Alphaproteobacteria bacterium]|uniref:Uncharacterized protein n=1 Tax=viral metagenome TaxID=1070528 RepID=A0A6H1ZBC3_9ZZZZ|nr:hypothetical protein [Alphaproteobacteria bacterium]